MSYGVAQSDKTWAYVLAHFKAGTLNEDALKVAWFREMFRIFGEEIEEAKLRQAEPLFEHKWSPAAAAEHLRGVWALKRWPLPARIKSAAEVTG